MKHIKIFEEEKSKIRFANDFFGVKIWSDDSETNKKITKLAKEHKMFLLASQQGVKYFISNSQSDVESFKKSIATL